MTKKRKKAKGFHNLPQRRGRSLKPGPRYACGKLRTPAPKEDPSPNESIMAIRRAILENPSANLVELRPAENPLDTALALKLITGAEHRAGEMLADVYRRAGLMLPTMRTQDLAREIRGGTEGSGDPKAMAELRKCAAALKGWPKPTGALIDMVVLGNWPAWMIERLDRVGPPTAQNEIGRTHLRTALRIVGKVFGTGEVKTASGAAA